MLRNKGKRNGMYGHKQSNDTKDKIGIANSGKNNARYKEVGSIVIRGDKVHIKVSKHKWMLYHRYLVEQYIGRKLKRQEEIHHINGNSLNNKLKNLYVFPNRESHSGFEALVRNNLIDRFYFKSNLKELKEK